jgi:energy-coupling factor transporter ATP-binding protein EcfA2
MYELHSLGWVSFQRLCLTITREVLGQTVESFLDSNDAGRDGAFVGHWNPTGHEDLTGRFVIQCKFTSRMAHVLRPSDLTDEVNKVRRLVQQGRCDSYVLMTNSGVSGRQAEELEALLRGAGVKHVVLLGETWINQQIRENKRLRMLVPRVYGLGDLSQILDERAYAQARSILDSLREDLSKVVVTDAYRKAAAALDQHGFVLLIGEPAAGKTTIASMLAMTAADQWNSSVLKLADPGKVAEHWNPDEPSQFFWIDDAFGVTQYEAFLVHGWNHILPQVKTMLRKGAKVVMTSRDYIYNRARNEIKEGAFPLLVESQVVIDVHDLSGEEKQQILYNHLKLGRQPSTFRSRVKPHLEHVAANPTFIPEIARRLGDPLFTGGLHLDPYHLGQFVEKRELFLQQVLQGLDDHSKASLGLIFMRNGRLESPITLQQSEEQALERLGSNLGGCVAGLKALNGSLVLHSHADGDSAWRFKHPTIGDAYAAILAKNPELLGVFIQGSEPNKLIEQITCGDVGIEKAIIIPRALFPQMLVKLSEFSLAKRYKTPGLSVWAARSTVQRFLARRCSKDFLSLYLENNPDLLDHVAEPGLYLAAVSEVDVAVRLHEFGLLPEDRRQGFVETVSEYAIKGDDLHALVSVGIRSLFAGREFEELLQNVRTKLLPRLHDVRRDVEVNHRSEPPDEHMQQLFDSFDILRTHLGGDAHAAAIIEREIQLANQWIAEKTPEEPVSTPRTLGTVEVPDKLHGTRSVFDDIDA